MAHTPIHSLVGATSPKGTASALDRAPEGAPTLDLAANIDGKPGTEEILVYTGFFQYGREIAIWSGALQVQPDVVDSARNMAQSAAGRLAAAAYDPKGNIADAGQKERIDAVLSRIGPLRARIVAAEQLTDKQRSARSLLGEEPRRPEERLVMVLATVGTAVPVGLSLYEGPARTWLDEPEATIAAVVGALVLSALPVITLVRSASVDTPEDRGMHRMWLGACGALSVVVYLVAAGAAQDGGDHLRALSYALGAGLCLLVTGLFTYGLARSYRLFREKRPAWAAATQQIEAAERRESQLRSELAGCEAKVADHDERVRQREHFRRMTELVRRAAENAVVAGYNAGIAENRGEGGASVRAPTPVEVRKHLGLPQSTPATS